MGVRAESWSLNRGVPRGARSTPSRAASSRVSRLLFALVVGLGTALVGALPARAAAVVVSLTFDDGSASQYSVSQTLDAHGMKGTFYVNSGLLGTDSYYMPWSQVEDIASRGHEIAGHTVNHVNLTTVNTATATAEVCNDRTTLLNHTPSLGSLTSFAYPEAAVGSTRDGGNTETIVKNCGYSSGRGVGPLYSHWETIPPGDPYFLSTADGITSRTTTADLESSVTSAELAGGGWVIYAFHGVCDNSCTSTNTVTTATFGNFVTWLQQEVSAGRAVIQTVGQVMGGPPPPAGPTTSIACNGTTCSSYYNAPVQVTLTATGATATYYTTDGTTPTTSSTRYTVPFPVSQTATITYFSTSDTASETPKSQSIQFDTAAPTVSAPTVNGQTVTTVSRRTRTVTVSATATDTGGAGIASVVFKDGTTTIGTATAAALPPAQPGTYQVTWNVRAAGVGTHTLTATATDAAGNVTVSDPATITVTR